VYDYLVVGAGFAGCVVAERLAREKGKRVLLVEKRNHIGGNAYDCYDDSGILIHKYGAHIFHTNSKKVVDYLSQFTEWTPYHHKVLTYVQGQMLPLPINLDTANRLWGTTYTSSELAQVFKSLSEPKDKLLTSEDAIVSQVGRELYELFFRGYTQKQWGMDPSQLDRSVTSRVPIRTNRDPRYFTDKYQMIPRHGYTKMFQRMLDTPGISLMLNTDYRAIIDEVAFDKVVYTGPIDVYFDGIYGWLPYRSVELKFETHPTEWFQPAATVNYPNDYEFTRITEFKRITGQRADHTTILYEYPTDAGEPYYPVPAPEPRALYKRYADEAQKLRSVEFVGRLATYQYYNMDQVVASALVTIERLG